MSWLVFLVACWLLLVLLLWPRRQSDPIQARLKDLAAGPALSTLGLPEPEPEEPKRSLQERLKRTFVGLVEKVPVRERSQERLQRQLQQAGLRWRAGEFNGLQIGLAILLAFFLTPLLAGPLGLLLGVLAGWVLPIVWLRRKQAQRLKAFGSQLAEGIGMLANALRSGYSFLQAMDVVSRDMPEPIAGEFAQVLRESRLNIPLDTALAGLSRRVPSEDLELLVTAVLIQRQVGGNLSEILDRIQDTIRDRIKLQGQIRTYTAQGRMSGWIVSLLPAGLLGILSLINPEYVHPLFHHPLGWLLIGMAVVMQTIGVTVIRRMVNMEV